MTAIRAGIAAYNARSLVPLEAFGWDTYEARLARYAISEGYYNNITYKQLATYSARLKAEGNLYQHIRAIYNPVYRQVEAYTAKVYGGGLDFEDLTAGAIPIIMADDTLRAAIKQVWIWSNWRSAKSVYVRQGATLGDVALKVVDQPDRGKVRIEVLHASKIKDVEFDSVGNVKRVEIEYARDDDSANNLRDRSYVYTEVIDGETFATYRDGEPFAFYNDANGSPIPSWPNPYGFVPLVMVKHKDLGLQFGANAFHSALGKIDELNDAASLLNDQVRKAINVMWYFAGVTAKDDLKSTAGERDKLPAIYGPADSQPFPMIANIDISAAGVNVERMLAELERDMPELSMHRLRDGGNLTAPGVRSAYNDAIDRFIEAQGNYDDGLIRAQKMAVSIGGFRGYDGFSAFNLDSYAAGDLEHFIGERAIISDELTKQEKIAALQAAGVPVQLILRELGYDEEDIEDVLAWQEEQARGAVRALAANVFGEDEADEDVDEDADTDATAGTEDAEA